MSTISIDDYVIKMYILVSLAKEWTFLKNSNVFPQNLLFFGGGRCFLLFIIVVLETEPWSLRVLGKHSTTERPPPSAPSASLFNSYHMIFFLLSFLEQIAPD